MSGSLLNQPLLVMTNVPEQALADSLARALVEQGLAACVNVLAPVASTYRWQGAIEHATEIPVLVKTTQARYLEVEQAILQAHPYDVPEIVALPLATGLPAYLAWMQQETAKPARV
ncbi:divalent-cation tolerance protein CutA [Herbaspirillum sp. WKF16]|jgi:periplasmic divalent cation tolerance protein|uniref:divalent-cation tolerance protein CutA n=1 Tax=Herbaspirillum sp. WKF16 TaxID=3028312 RepID=UPI0023A9CED7|nr:divalent-cation tolerance protein CutA [Herbaspirillum sp. WKF16]WDZ96353.1 divalent-cation tolerance protein CutA [Herbaspirillum sp. WKF16]